MLLTLTAPSCLFLIVCLAQKSISNAEISVDINSNLTSRVDGAPVECNCTKNASDDRILQNDPIGHDTDEEDDDKKPPPPYALSATYLTYLATFESDLYKEMAEYATQTEERLSLIRKYLKDYEDSTHKATHEIPDNVDPLDKAKHVASHPLLSYRMVHRLATEFHDVLQHVGKQIETRLENMLWDFAQDHGLPTKNDVYDGMEGILRLHYTYDLDLRKFTNGHFGTTITNSSLPIEQIFEIAEYATENEYFTLAKDWLELTEHRLKESGNNNETDNETKGGVTREALEGAIQLNVDSHDARFDTYPEENTYMFESRLGSAENGNVTTVKETLLGVLTKGEDNGGVMWYMSKAMKHQTDNYRFLGLCNGKNYQSEKAEKELSCWYDSTRSAFFGPINPLKMELLNKDPMLLQIYDVIGEEWTNKLINYAEPTLKRAPAVYGQGITHRTASYAWLSDEEIPDIPISRRIELITGLNVRGRLASEDLQIASYAYGGHVAVHVDSLGKNSDTETMGDRVTTFLIYLNEVEEGGYTAFPILGTQVKPVKHSAVLWYTALKNGDIDNRMLHGACPVILGHKWIATKWSNLNENFLKRPCGLDKFV